MVRFPHYPDLSTQSLLDLYDSIRRALAEDDKLPLAQRKYGVRDFADWREQADELENELDTRNIEYIRIRW